MLYAILIDGGFVRRVLGNSQKPADATDIRKLVTAIKRSEHLKGQILHRVYYYDAIPLTERVIKPLGGGPIDFSTTALSKRSSELFNTLKVEPFFAMRMGETSFNGWKVLRKTLDTPAPILQITSDDIFPDISQKGVDMRIGMDIAALTLKRIVHTLVLVTGDSDFVPAMKFARREGANLFIVSLDHKIKDGMEEHSDIDLGITVEQVKSIPI